MDLIVTALKTIGSTTIDVLPIAAFLIGFQALVIRKPLPNAKRMLAGFALVIAGLGLFLIGLEQALFPVGRLMATQLTSPEVLGVDTTTGIADWTAYFWVYAFAVAIGFSTTIAEPSLLAVAMKANEVSGGAISVWGLRVAVALGVAVGVGLAGVELAVAVQQQQPVVLRRGRPQGMEARGTSQVVRAAVPMSEMLNYAPALRSMTQGRASFHMEFSHYEEAPRPVQDKIIAEYEREKEESG